MELARVRHHQDRQRARADAATLLGTTEAFATVHDLFVEKGRFMIRHGREPRHAAWP